MELSTIIFFTILVICVILIVMYFNKLVTALNLNKEAFSNVDVALKKRYDLIPNLEAVVKAYAGYESDTLKQITEIREKLQENLSVGQRQKVEDKLSGVIKDVFVSVENYPDLKSNQNFLEFQKGLTKVEEDIENARKYYNGATRNYNIIVQKFPTNILAKLFGFKQSDYFEVDLLTRDNVQVDFGNDEPKQEEVNEQVQNEVPEVNENVQESESNVENNEEEHKEENN